LGEYDNYRARLGDNGSSISGAFADQSTQLINAAFTDSPMYQQASIGGTLTDTRVIRGIDPYMKVLTFRPNATIYIGEIATLSDGTEWLIEKYDAHPYFPKADIARCNQVFNWKDSSGNVKSYPCVMVSLKRKTTVNKDAYMEVANYQLFCNVPYNPDTSTIREGLRVVLGSQVYQIGGVDDSSNIYDGHGYIQYGVDIVVSNPYDDFTNKIADNKVYYEQNSTIAPITPPANGGGTIKW
jgi:hypothetical protein